MSDVNGTNSLASYRELSSGGGGATSGTSGMSPKPGGHAKYDAASHAIDVS